MTVTVTENGLRIKIGGRLKRVWTKYIKDKCCKLLVWWETHKTSYLKSIYCPNKFTCCCISQYSFRTLHYHLYEEARGNFTDEHYPRLSFT